MLPAAYCACYAKPVAQVANSSWVVEDGTNAVCAAPPTTHDPPIQPRPRARGALPKLPETVAIRDLSLSGGFHPARHSRWWVCGTV